MYGMNAYHTGVTSKPGLSERLSEATRDSYTWLRDYVTAIKYGRIHPFTNVERKAREATRKDPWGPTGHQLAELAELSHHPDHCQVIFAVLEFRMSRGPQKWRNVYKALLALEYLLVRGSDFAVQCCHGREITTLLQQLTNFEAIGQGGVDYGQNVRIRSAAILERLNDRDLLQQRRQAAAARFGAISPLYNPRDQQQQQQWGQPPAAAAAAFGGYSRDQMLLQQQQYGGSSSSINGYNANDNRFSSDLGLGSSSGSSAQQQQQQRAAAAAVGGFGEAKGVSFEENKLRVAELKKLLAKEENRRCADCQDPTPAGRPSWASVNLGVFICMRCAGHHRGLGAHISKVRSCSLDTWLPEQVTFLAQTGNAAANAHFEANFGSSSSNNTVAAAAAAAAGSSAFRRPARDSPEMASFIRQKYAEKKWVAAGSIWPPVLPAAAAAVPQQPAAAAAAAAIRPQQQQQTVQSHASLGFEDNAFPAAPAAAAAAAGSSSPAAAAAAAGPVVADLLCLDDDQGSRLMANGTAAAAVRQQQQRQQQSWDIMDAPMDIPAPNVSVLDWIEQRIATGADAAAQAAADAARQQRQQHRHQHMAAAAVANGQRQQPQQQRQQYVFDPFVAPQQQQQQQGIGQTSGAAAAANALQQQQQQQNRVENTGQANPTAAGKIQGVLHSITAGIQQLGSAAAAAAGSSNMISTYEYTFSSSEDESDDDLEIQNVTNNNHRYNTSVISAAAAAPKAGSSNLQQQSKPSGSSSSTTMPLIPATPGFYTSNPAAAAAGLTGQSAAAAAGFTGGYRSGYRPPFPYTYQPQYTSNRSSAAAGFTGSSRPPAAAGFTGSSRPPAAAGYTGSNRAAAGFTGSGQSSRVHQHYPQVPAGVPVVMGFNGYGGWGGFNSSMAAAAAAPRATGTAAPQQQQQQ